MNSDHYPYIDTSGMSLSIARAIAITHRGSLKVINGSKYCCKFPYLLISKLLRGLNCFCDVGALL